MNERDVLQEQAYQRCRLAEGQQAELRVQVQNKERRSLSLKNVHEESFGKPVARLGLVAEKGANLQRELSTVTASDTYLREAAKKTQKGHGPA